MKDESEETVEKNGERWGNHKHKVEVEKEESEKIKRASLK